MGIIKRPSYKDCAGYNVWDGMTLKSIGPKNIYKQPMRTQKDIQYH